MFLYYSNASANIRFQHPCMVQKSSFFFQTEMSLFFDLDLLSLLPEDKFMILKFVVCVCVCETSYGSQPLRRCKYLSQYLNNLMP